MSEERRKVKFMQYTCIVTISQYANERKAIELIDANDGSPILVASINVPKERLDDDEVIIKNYSENEGILDVLISEGIVEKTGRTVDTGFTTCEVCKLLI